MESAILSDKVCVCVCVCVYVCVWEGEGGGESHAVWSGRVIWYSMVLVSLPVETTPWACWSSPSFSFRMVSLNQKRVQVVLWLKSLFDSSMCSQYPKASMEAIKSFDVDLKRCESKWPTQMVLHALLLPLEPWCVNSILLTATVYPVYPQQYFFE